LNEERDKIVAKLKDANVEIEVKDKRINNFDDRIETMEDEAANYRITLTRKDLTIQNLK
jgi:hypothetical protein